MIHLDLVGEMSGNHHETNFFKTNLVSAMDLPIKADGRQFSPTTLLGCNLKAMELNGTINEILASNHPPFSPTTLLGRNLKAIELENVNNTRISELSTFTDIDIDSSQFPRILSRYGEIEWFNEAKRLYDERSKGSPNYKIYNDCLIETKPSWLILNRNELSDDPWTKTDKSNEYTHELKLYDLNVETIHYQGPVLYSVYYENKNKQLIMDRMKLEETLICENADIERIGRLLFYQNMQIMKTMKENGINVPQTIQINNSAQISSHGALYINAPISIGFSFPIKF